VNRVVHLSTTEVYGNASGQIDETFPYQHTGNPYGDSKIEAERLCWEYCGQGLPVTVIRPPIVYGPFSKWWTVGLAQKLLSGRWGVFEGYGDGICNLVYVADLVSGILLAAHEERAVGEAFNLNGPEPLTWNQYFQRFNAALGLPELNPVKPNTAHLRAAITQPMRDSAYFVLRRFGGPIRRMYQRFARAKDLMQYAERSLRTTARLSDLNLYSREAMYVSGKAREILGYVPRFNVDDGLQLSVRWLQHLGLATPVATGTGGQGESFAVPSG
jgi:nucleoside-diphosphate-sugar epimerase